MYFSQKDFLNNFAKQGWQHYTKTIGFGIKKCWQTDLRNIRVCPFCVYRYIRVYKQI